MAAWNSWQPAAYRNQPLQEDSFLTSQSFLRDRFLKQGEVSRLFLGLVTWFMLANVSYALLAIALEYLSKMVTFCRGEGLTAIHNGEYPLKVVPVLQG